MAVVGTKQQERVRWDEPEEENGGYFILPPIDMRPKENYRRKAIKNRSHGGDKRKIKTNITELIFGSEVEEPYAFGDPLVIASKGVLRMACRICCKDDDHWSFECPDIALQTETSVNRSSTEPPICRVCKQPDVMKCGIEEASVLLMNLPKETCESDLVDLVRRFGPLTLACLSMDEKANSTRKFAVVEYVQRKDAEKAISLLNGFDYYNAILQVEWATPRQEAAYPPVCPSCMEASESCVRVTNISEKITGRDFLDLFCRSGLLTVAYLDADKMTGSQTKFGITEYCRRADAETAISLLNGFDIFDLKPPSPGGEFTLYFI